MLYWYFYSISKMISDYKIMYNVLNEYMSRVQDISRKLRVVGELRLDHDMIGYGKGYISILGDVVEALGFSKELRSSLSKATVFDEIRDKLKQLEQLKTESITLTTELPQQSNPKVVTTFIIDINLGDVSVKNFKFNGCEIDLSGGYTGRYTYTLSLKILDVDKCIESMKLLYVFLNVLNTKLLEVARMVLYAR